MCAERLSLADDTLIASYADHIVRYEFALRLCGGKRVLDAGCGTGYGSHFLASKGAADVLAVDISEEALTEARANYRRANLRFERMDVQEIPVQRLQGSVDVVVNFENIEHLPHPERLVDAVAALVRHTGGLYVTSSPNGALSEFGPDGKLLNPFHVHEFTREEFTALLGPRFRTVELYGQWVTHDGMLRKLRTRETFEQLCEAYYNPMCRVGRALKRLLGRRVAPPPQLTSGGDGYRGDFVIEPIDESLYRWPPMALLAVCRA